MTPAVWQALAMKHGLKFYMATGRRINTLYTPANMLRTVSKITGNPYGKKQFQEAIDDLEEWLEGQK